MFLNSKRVRGLGFMVAENINHVVQFFHSLNPCCHIIEQRATQWTVLLAWSTVPLFIESMLSYHWTETYSVDCPNGMVYSYSASSCGRSCRALSQPDPTCQISTSQVDGCVCPEGTFLDQSGQCVGPSLCPCYEGEHVVTPGQTLRHRGATWWGTVVGNWKYLISLVVFLEYIYH